MKKLIYILSHPIQYQSPLLKKLAQQPEIDLKVLYLTKHTMGGTDRQFGKKIKWDIPLLDGYDYEFIKNHSPKAGVSGSFFGLMNFGIVHKIRKEKADVVLVHGWGYFTNWLIFLFSFLIKAKLWMRSESPLNQELLKPKALLTVKKAIIKHLVFKHFDKFLYIGKQNKDFYKYYGIAEHKLIFTPYAVDNEYYQKQYREHIGQKAKIKEEIDLPLDAKVILSVGKYIAKKRPLDILKAYNKLNDKNKALLMVGEGKLRPEMEAYIRQNNLKNVFLTGFINASQIYKYFIAADLFVLASGAGETWGLVTNEAMNFGLPVITSDMPGSAYDLIEEGKNGYVFKTGGTDELSAFLDEVINLKSVSSEMKEYILKKMDIFSYNTIVNNVVINGM